MYGQPLPVYTTFDRSVSARGGVGIGNRALDTGDSGIPASTISKEDTGV
jgi:hypothetical protein